MVWFGSVRYGQVRFGLVRFGTGWLVPARLTLVVDEAKLPLLTKVE